MICQCGSGKMTKEKRIRPRIAQRGFAFAASKMPDCIYVYCYAKI